MVPKFTTAPARAVAAPNTSTRPPQHQGQRSHKRPKTQLDQQPASGSHAQAYEAAGEATMRRKRQRDEGGERLETRAGPPTPPAETKTTRVVLLKDVADPQKFRSRVNRLRAVQRLHDEVFAKCAGRSPVRDLMVLKNGGVRIELRSEEHVSMFLKADIPRLKIFGA